MAAKTDKAAGLNKGQAGVPFYTPAQEPAAGTAAQTDSTPSLFRPLRMGPLELHNRLVVSPMCQYSADDGHLTDYHLVHLGQMALQGAGLVFVEATAVEPRGRISPQDAGLWADSQTGPLRRIVDFVHSQNTKIGIQLAHSGRKASTLAPWIGGSANKALAEEQEGGWPGDVVGPSPLPYAADHAMPQELTVDGIRHVVKAFADATERAVKAGVDVVEIHGAHGYLISSFLSPRSNVSICPRLSFSQAFSQTQTHTHTHTPSLPLSLTSPRAPSVLTANAFRVRRNGQTSTAAASRTARASCARSSRPCAG